MRILSLFILVMSFHSLNSIPNPLAKIYPFIFGNGDASEQYQKLVHQAFQEYGYSKDFEVPVKKMNTVGQKIIGAQLYSFTLFGIWLNEELLDAADENVRQWMIYHEVAHSILAHHAIAIALSAFMVPFIGSSYYLTKFATKSTALGSLAAGLCSIGVLQHIIKPAIKEQEKEADLAALRVLITLKKQEVIVGYLKHLQELIDQGYGHETDGWHYTVHEQYEYLIALRDAEDIPSNSIDCSDSF